MEKIFEGLDSVTERMMQQFELLIRNISVKHLFVAGGDTPPNQEQIYTKTVIARPGDQDTNKRIIFSLNLQSGHITVVFVVNINNQYKTNDSESILWCLKAGAHFANIQLVFEKFTHEAKYGLSALVDAYFADDTQSFVEMFLFKKETVSA